MNSYALVAGHQLPSTGKRHGIMLMPAKENGPFPTRARAEHAWSHHPLNDGHHRHTVVPVTGDDRQQRAINSHWVVRPGTKEGWWQVESPKNGHRYTVRQNGSVSCSCPDHTMRGAVCKHIHVVQIATKVAQDKGGAVKKEEPAADWRAALARPFGVEQVSWKPQEYSGDGQQAKAVAYGKLRAYEDRLNEVVPDWKSRAQVVVAGDRLVCIIHLTINGVTRSGVGECQINDRNAATSAYAQAFKRACSTFGLGRHLYTLPKEWEECDGEFFTEAALQRLNALYCRVTGLPDEPPASNGAGNGTAKATSGNGSMKQATGKPPTATLGQRQKIAALLTSLGYKTAKRQHEALQQAGFSAPLSEPEATLAIRRLEAAAAQAQQA